MYDLQLLRKSLGIKDRKKPIPYPTQSIEAEEYIGEQYKDPQDRALFYILYLGGQRISELLNTTRLSVSIETNEGFEHMIISSLTEKNRSQPRRIIPIPLYGKEKRMSEHVWKYINSIQGNNKLFDITRNSAWYRLSKVSLNNLAIDKDNKIIEQETKIFCHYQRHCRASHMVMFYGYDIMKLMQLFGWSSPSVPNVYVMLNWESLAKPMINKNI